jgi:hypothetical protein
MQDSERSKALANLLKTLSLEACQAVSIGPGYHVGIQVQAFYCTA